MPVETKVKKIISDLCGGIDVNLDTALRDDLGIDSLDMVNFMFELEEVFGIELEALDMNPLKFTTVQSVIDLIKKYGGED